VRFSARTNWELAPNRLSEAIAGARAAGRELLDLTESNPTRCGLHYDAEAILDALHAPAALTYEPDPHGLLVAREAVARYYAQRGDRTPDAGHIFLTTSTSEAYSYIFRLQCDPGDEVLAPAPSYPLFDYLARLHDVTLRHYELFYDAGCWHIDVAGLRQALTPRTRAIMLVHPNNPTGSFISVGERAALNQLCAERDLALVADEVFLDYPHDGRQRHSFAGNADALTFTVSGLSKIAALPQMKVAWMICSGPAAAREAAVARLEVIADTFLSMNAPIQHAVPALLGERHDVRDQLFARVRANLAALDRQLAQQTLCSRLGVEAGWYAVLRVPAHGDDEGLALALLEHAGVVVHPGHFYDFADDGYLVLSLIPPPPLFAEGVRLLLAYIASEL